MEVTPALAAPSKTGGVPTRSCKAPKVSEVLLAAEGGKMREPSNLKIDIPLEDSVPEEELAASSFALLVP